MFHTNQDWKKNPSSIVKYFSDKNGNTKIQEVNNEVYEDERIFIVKVELYRNTLKDLSIQQMKFYLEKKNRINKIELGFYCFSKMY